MALKSKRTNTVKCLTILFAIVMGVAACTSPGQGSNKQGSAADAKAFYKGKTVKLSVGSSPGGGFDTYARLLAPYLAKALGAHVVVSNEPGAGGVVMLNNLVTEKDPDKASLHLAEFNGPGIGPEALAGSPQVHFDLTKLTYIGRIGWEPPVFLVSAKSPYHSIKDVINHPGFKFGVSGKGSTGYMNTEILVRTLGLNAKVITSFPGTSEYQRALLAGDIDGVENTLDEALPTIQSGDVRPILVVSKESPPQLKDVANISDLKPNSDAQQLWNTQIAMNEFLRPVAGGPAIPKVRAEFLQKAFHQAMTDPQFTQAAKKANRPLTYGSPQDMEKIVNTAVHAPKAYKDLAKTIFE